MTDIVELGFKADTSGIKATDKALDGLGRTGDRTADKLDKSAKRTNTTFSQLNATLGIVGASIAALGSAALTREAIQYSDAWKSVNNQLRQVTDSNQELITTQQLIVNLSKETRSDLLATTELYSELTRATESLGTTQDEVLSVTRTLNNLFLAGGKSAQESSGAIRQLGQALGAGALRGDEFNSVAEGAPRILDALSESLGMAKGELREFAATGGITAEILTKALLDYEDAAQAAADKTEVTFAQIKEVTATNTTEAIGSIESLDRIIRSLGLGMVDLSESFVDSANAIDFVITELERSLAISFARIGGFFEVVGAEIEFSLSSPIDFAIGKIVDLSQALIQLGSFAGNFLGLNTEILDQWIINLEEIRPKTVAEHNAMLNEIRSNTDRVVGLLNEQYDSYGDKIIENLVVKQSAAIDTTESLEKAQEKLAPAIGATADEIDKILDSSIDKFDRLGSVFTNTGNGIIDTFGEAVSVLTEFGNRIEYITEEQEKYRAVLNSQNATIEQQRQAKMALTQLDEAALSANLAGIGSLLGASANLFEEQSKEREILHRLEMGFLAAEMALAAQKAVVNAVNAITNQGNGDPYSAFARIATMTGIMVGILGAIGASISSSGGGYSSPTVGTGTTLGDSEAQSGSVNAGLELFEDIQLDQLAELRGIRSSMSDLAGAISQLTRDVLGAGGLDMSFVQGLGKTGSGSFLKDVLSANPINAIPIVGDLFGSIVSGLFGSTRKKIIDQGIQFTSQTFEQILTSGALEANVFAAVETTKKKLFGLIRNSSTDIITDPVSQELSNSLGAIFGSIASTLMEAGDLLGVAGVDFVDGTQASLAEALNMFEIPELNISFEGKTGEEIEQELQAAIGAIGDDLADFLFPSLREYQQINEGMYETVLRVAKETVIFNDALEKMGVTVEDLGFMVDVAFGQAVITAIGGLEEFSDAFNSFYDNFYTEQEKFLNLQNSLNDVFRELNIQMPTTEEEFRRIVEETAALGEEGADTLAALLELSPAMAEFTDQVKDLTESFNASRTAFASFSDFITILEANTTGGLFQGLGDISMADTDMLVEQFGSIEAFMSAVLDFSNRFLSDTRSLEVQQATLMSSLSTLDDQFDLSDDLQNYISRLFSAIGSSGDASRDDILAIENLFESALTMGVNNADLQSGAFEALLSLQPGVESLLDRLALMREEMDAAAETEAALQDERNNRTLDLQVDLLRAQGHELEAVSLERAREIEALQEYDEQNQTNLASLQSLIYLQEDWNNSLADSENALGSALDMLNNAVSAQASEISNVIGTLDSALNSIESGLRNLEGARIGTMDLALRELDSILASARTGDFSNLGSLDISTLTAGDTSRFSSAMEFNLEQARIGSKLEELADLTQAERDVQQTELDALNSMLELAQQQYDAIMGVEEVITDAEAANVLFNQRLIELQALQLASQDTSLEGQQEFADLQLALIEAQNVNFLALMELTDEQRQEIVDHLMSLNQANQSFNETFANSFALLTTNMAGFIGGNDQLNATLRELTSNQWHGMNRLNDTLRELTSNQWHGLNRTNDLLAGLSGSAANDSIFDFDYFMEIFKAHYSVTALNMGYNKTSSELLGHISRGSGSGITGGSWQLNRIISHQQDIDYNTHITAARSRIANAHMNDIKTELSRVTSQMKKTDSKMMQYLASIDNNTEETARNQKKIELNGLRLRAS